MKKFLGLVLIIVIALFGFAACTDSNPDGSGGGNTTQTTQPGIDEEGLTKMYITINGNKAEVTLYENRSVDALVERLKQGDITYTASDYGGFEKVGVLGFSLPADDTEITTQAGDVILYSGNQIVLFYGSNSWQYTKIGRIEGYSVSELRSFLCAGGGSVQVTISLK